MSKVIIVTGGSGLLGKSFISTLSARGYTAINADISVTDSVENKTVQTDVTNIDSIKNCIRWTLNHFGRIDGLVNNAYPRTKDWGNKFEDIPLESWKQNVDWQLNSIFAVSKEMSAVFKSQGYGSIVNISSIYGMLGPDFTIYEGTEMTMPAAYSAIKGGIINFTKYLASYYGRENIRVNCISPGGIIDGQPQQFVDSYESKVPLGRMGTPEDVAPVVAFLLSDDARYITGQNIAVDGGWTIV